MSGTVAITGATGLIGRHLRRTLADRDVVLLTRTKPPTSPNERWQHLELTTPFTLDGLPAGTVLVHLAYAHAAGRHNLGHAEHLVTAVTRHGALERVIHGSTVSVYGQAATGAVNEETPCDPDSEYARTKHAIEGVLAGLPGIGCQLCIVRPSTVIGEGGIGLVSLIDAALRRPARGVLRRSVQHQSTVHFVAVETVAAALRFLLDGGQRDNVEIFVIADDDQPENASYAAMQDAVRACCGLDPLPTIPLPGWTLGPLGHAVGRSLGRRCRFSSAKLAEAGFHNPAVLGDEIRRAVLRQVGTARRGVASP